MSIPGTGWKCRINNRTVGVGEQRRLLVSTCLHHRRPAVSEESVDSSQMVKLLHEVYGESVEIDGRPGAAASVRPTPSRLPISSLSFIGFRYLFSFRRSSSKHPRERLALGVVRHFPFFFFFSENGNHFSHIFRNGRTTSPARTCAGYINRYYE